MGIYFYKIFTTIDRFNFFPRDVHSRNIITKTTIGHENTFSYLLVRILQRYDECFLRYRQASKGSL